MTYSTYKIIKSILFYSSTYFVLRETNRNIFYFKIFQTFSQSIWICLLITIISFTISLKLISKLKIDDPKSIQTLLILGVYCQQGFNTRFSSISIHCLITFLHLSGIVAFNFYTSNLVSTLVDSKFQFNINTLDDIANSDIPVGFDNTSITRQWILVFFLLL